MRTIEVTNEEYAELIAKRMKDANFKRGYNFGIDTAREAIKGLSLNPEDKKFLLDRIVNYI